MKEFIDPGLQCDAYADEPWLYGPSLSCWFAFRLGEKVEDGQEFPEPGEENVTREGADGSGREERDRLGLPENNEKRRKFFLDAKNRESFVFQKGRCYQVDFFNPYLDFGNCALKLPGFSLNVIKYVDQKSHYLRYVFKNRESGNVYLNVNIALLWNEDLKRAQEADKAGDAALQASLGGEVDRSVKETSPHGSPQDNKEETKVDSGRVSDEQEISNATRAMDINSEQNSNSGEINRSSPVTDAETHDSSVAGRQIRPTVSGLTAVEHVSNGEAPVGVDMQQSHDSQVADTTSVKADGVQEMLQATATNDKRGSEVGIF